MPVTMELKFDGKRAVSGTMTGLPNPAEVKSGTFDPKTGALVLRLGKKDGDAVLLVFEGTVANGAATGRFSGEVTRRVQDREEVTRTVDPRKTVGPRERAWAVSHAIGWSGDQNGSAAATNSIGTSVMKPRSHSAQ